LVRNATATTRSRRRGTAAWRSRSSSIIGRVGGVAEEKKGGRKRWGGGVKKDGEADKRAQVLVVEIE
jgi:hypothetical protein